MLSKKTVLIFISVFAVLMTFLALGSFDYNFSRSIIDPHSPWANFFDQFGEIPAFLLMLIGIAILFGARKKEVLWRNILSHVLALPFMALFSYAITFMPVKYMFENHATGLPEDVPQILNIITLLLGILLFAVVLILQYRADDTKLKEMKKAAVLFIVLIIGEMVLVNVVKVIWGRPRMRMLETMDDFRKWYVIKGPAPGNEYKSFPSGHTANGFAAIGFTLFFSYFKTVNKKLILIFAIVWGTLVALSRVVLGAHFLSDVITGGYITILLFFALNSLFFRKRES